MKSDAGVAEEWAGFGRRVEAHLAVIEAELAALRQALRGAGVEVRRPTQRVRITPRNQKAMQALAFLKAVSQDASRPSSVTPATVATHVGVSPEYAYDLLASLVAAGHVGRVRRGHYALAE